MVKANGYGLGAVEVARALEALDPWGYGVATAGEGSTLRAAGVDRPIVVFTPFRPQDRECFLRHDLRPVVGDLEGLEALLAVEPVPYHVEIDTGMGRAGFRWDGGEALDRLRELVSRTPPEGVFTHFHSGDDPASCREQWDRFEPLVASLPRRPPLIHAANSAAALQGPAFAADLVRPGIFLYGGAVAARDPRVVVRLRAAVVATRELRAGDSVSYDATWRAPGPVTVATLGVGYADGVPRTLGNRGAVELDGRELPIVGRVTMDMTMVASDRPLRTGQVATVYGDRVTLDRQARAAGTIAYELLTGLGDRVERRYRRTQ